MDAKDFYLTCLNQASDVVKHVQAAQLANQTPDDQWNVADLINHMLYEVSWVPAMVQGNTMAEMSNQFQGDLFDRQSIDPERAIYTAWLRAATTAEQAVDACDAQAVAHLSYGDVLNEDYLHMTGGDILVHSWDLAKSIGLTFSFNTAVAQHMWLRVKDQEMTASGLFKPALPYDDNDSPQNKILAHFGRDKNWQPAA